MKQEKIKVNVKKMVIEVYVDPEYHDYLVIEEILQDDESVFSCRLIKSQEIMVDLEKAKKIGVVGIDFDKLRGK